MYKWWLLLLARTLPLLPSAALIQQRRLHGCMRSVTLSGVCAVVAHLWCRGLDGSHPKISRQSLAASVPCAAEGSRTDLRLSPSI